MDRGPTRRARGGGPLSAAARDRWCIAPRARDRIDAAVRWLDAVGDGSGVLIVGATVEASSALARHALGRPTSSGASFGWHRLSLGALAGRLAALELAARGRVPAPALSVEAVCARVLHERARASDDALGRFASVASEPGLPRALARTLRDLRLGRVGPDALERVDPDLAALLRAFDDMLEREGLADRALAYAAATDVVLGRGVLPSEEASAMIGLPVLLLDAPVDHQAEADLVLALVERAPSALATLPMGEGRAARLLERSLGALPAWEPRTQDAGARRASTRPAQLDLFAANAPREGPPASSAGDEEDDLARLQRALFTEGGGASPNRAADGTVDIFSAPGEGRECVEIARRVLAEADRGTPFDRMAVLLRTPELYRTAIADAFGRADVPFVPSRGSVRPNPSGRALLALLACRAEGYSARAFAEYLSLGALPEPEPDGAPPTAPEEADRWVAPDEEIVPSPATEPAPDAATPPPDPGAAARGRVLRSPRRWEKLLMDAAVVGGVDRWRRRLDGLARTFESERAARLRADPDDARASHLERKLEELGALRGFALPVLDDLAGLPDEAMWGAWLDALSALAHRTLREPSVVQRALAELTPMAPVGPVGLDEVRLVLEARLGHLVEPPADVPGGAVRVAAIDEARGLSFDVVFVPGLAERVFPQKLSEDPILLDAARRRLDVDLVDSDARVEAERVALRVAVGAAERRVVLSYPRIEVERARPRVPSFYALEVLRATTGKLPAFEALGRQAEASGGARMGWPAPDEAATAIDAAEFDLAVLRKLLEARDDDPQHGAARYLFDASAHLARALRFRARRWEIRAFKAADGLVDPPPLAVEALAAHQLDARPYSPTALEAYAACPYRFYLQAVLRLSPREVPEAVDELDPLQRGRLVHEAQRILLESLRERGELELAGEAATDAALSRLDGIVAEVADRYREELVPAIARVWEDGVDEVRADLREWLRRVAADRWRPRWFELAFGLPGREGHDPESVDEPIALDAGLVVRGSIDLVEEREDALRATDTKTGRNRVDPHAVVAGGRSLQPALYALALEKRFPDRRIDGGRLFYCTSRGGFSEHFVPLDEETRAAIDVLAKTVGDALSRGFLPAAPADGACEWCDYQPVCGPHEERRVRRKRDDLLEGLVSLRKRR